MSETRISKIQVRRGKIVDLPLLDAGEFGYAVDEQRLFIGNEITEIGIGNGVQRTFSLPNISEYPAGLAATGYRDPRFYVDGQEMSGVEIKGVTAEFSFAPSIGAVVTAKWNSEVEMRNAVIAPGEERLGKLASGANTEFQFDKDAFSAVFMNYTLRKNQTAVITGTERNAVANIGDSLEINGITINFETDANSNGFASLDDIITDINKFFPGVASNQNGYLRLEFNGQDIHIAGTATQDVGITEGIHYGYIEIESTVLNPSLHAPYEITINGTTVKFIGNSVEELVDAINYAFRDNDSIYALEQGNRLAIFSDKADLVVEGREGPAQVGIQPGTYPAGDMSAATVSTRLDITGVEEGDSITISGVTIIFTDTTIEGIISSINNAMSGTGLRIIATPHPEVYYGVELTAYGLVPQVRTNIRNLQTLRNAYDTELETEVNLDIRINNTLVSFAAADSTDTGPITLQDVADAINAAVGNEVTASVDLNQVKIVGNTYNNDVVIEAGDTTVHILDTNIRSVSPGNPTTVETHIEHGLRTGDDIVINNLPIELGELLNGNTYEITVISPTQFNIPVSTLGNVFWPAQFAQLTSNVQNPRIEFASLPKTIVINDNEITFNDANIDQNVGLHNISSMIQAINTQLSEDSTTRGIEAINVNNKIRLIGTDSNIEIGLGTGGIELDIEFIDWVSYNGGQIAKVTTVSPHGLVQGTGITIGGVNGMSGINKKNFYIDISNATIDGPLGTDQFYLYYDSGLTSPVNPTSFGTYEDAQQAQVTGSTVFATPGTTAISTDSSFDVETKFHDAGWPGSPTNIQFLASDTLEEVVEKINLANVTGLSAEIYNDGGDLKVRIVADSGYAFKVQDPTSGDNALGYLGIVDTTYTGTPSGTVHQTAATLLGFPVGTTAGLTRGETTIVIGSEELNVIGNTDPQIKDKEFFSQGTAAFETDALVQLGLTVGQTIRTAGNSIVLADVTEGTLAALGLTAGTTDPDADNVIVDTPVVQAGHSIIITPEDSSAVEISFPGNSTADGATLAEVVETINLYTDETDVVASIGTANNMANLVLTSSVRDFTLSAGDGSAFVDLALTAGTYFYTPEAKASYEGLTFGQGVRDIQPGDTITFTLPDTSEEVVINLGITGTDLDDVIFDLNSGLVSNAVDLIAVEINPNKITITGDVSFSLSDNQSGAVLQRIGLGLGVNVTYTPEAPAVVTGNRYLTTAQLRNGHQIVVNGITVTFASVDGENDTPVTLTEAADQITAAIVANGDPEIAIDATVFNSQLRLTGTRTPITVTAPAWDSGNRRTISISNDGNTSVEATNHQLQTGDRIYIEMATGTFTSGYYTVEVVDANTLELPGVTGTTFTASGFQNAIADLRLETLVVNGEYAISEYADANVIGTGISPTVEYESTDEDTFVLNGTVIDSSTADFENISAAITAANIDGISVVDQNVLKIYSSTSDITIGGTALDELDIVPGTYAASGPYEAAIISTQINPTLTPGKTVELTMGTDTVTVQVPTAKVEDLVAAINDQTNNKVEIVSENFGETIAFASGTEMTISDGTDTATIAVPTPGNTVRTISTTNFSDAGSVSVNDTFTINGIVVRMLSDNPSRTTLQGYINSAFANHSPAPYTYVSASVAGSEVLLTSAAGVDIIISDYNSGDIDAMKAYIGFDAIADTVTVDELDALVDNINETLASSPYNMSTILAEKYQTPVDGYQLKLSATVGNTDITIAYEASALALYTGIPADTYTDSDLDLTASVISAGFTIVGTDTDIVISTLAAMSIVDIAPSNNNQVDVRFAAEHNLNTGDSIKFSFDNSNTYTVVNIVSTTEVEIAVNYSNFPVPTQGGQTAMLVDSATDSVETLLEQIGIDAGYYEADLADGASVVGTIIDPVISGCHGLNLTYGLSGDAEFQVTDVFFTSGPTLPDVVADINAAQSNIKASLSNGRLLLEADRAITIKGYGSALRDLGVDSDDLGLELGNHRVDATVQTSSDDYDPNLLTPGGLTINGTIIGFTGNTLQSVIDDINAANIPGVTANVAGANQLQIEGNGTDISIGLDEGEANVHLGITPGHYPANESFPSEIWSKTDPLVVRGNDLYITANNQLYRIVINGSTLNDMIRDINLASIPGVIASNDQRRLKLTGNDTDIRLNNGQEASNTITRVWRDLTTGVVTVEAVAHGFANGQRVFITNVGGTTELNNNTFFVTVIDNDTFTLNGIDGSEFGEFEEAADAVIVGSVVNPVASDNDVIGITTSAGVSRQVNFNDTTYGLDLDGIISTINNTAIPGVTASEDAGKLVITGEGVDVTLSTSEQVALISDVQLISKAIVIGEESVATVTAGSTLTVNNRRTVATSNMSLQDFQQLATNKNISGVEFAVVLETQLSIISDAAIAIGEKTADVVRITITNGIATVVTSEVHDLITGDVITFAGTGEADYSGKTFRIVRVSDKEFTLDTNATAFSAYNSAGDSTPLTLFIKDTGLNLLGLEEKIYTTENNIVTVTALNHSFVTGDHVRFGDVQADPFNELDNTAYDVFAINRDQFQLRDRETGELVDGTGFNVEHFSEETDAVAVSLISVMGFGESFRLNGMTIEPEGNRDVVAVADEIKKQAAINNIEINAFANTSGNLVIASSTTDLVVQAITETTRDISKIELLGGSSIVVTTSVAHGFSDSDYVRITEVEGVTGLNENTYKVRFLSNTRFELLNADSSIFVSYVFGGTVTKSPLVNLGIVPGTYEYVPSVDPSVTSNGVSQRIATGRDFVINGVNVVISSDDSTSEDATNGLATLTEVVADIASYGISGITAEVTDLDDSTEALKITADDIDLVIERGINSEFADISNIETNNPVRVTVPGNDCEDGDYLLIENVGGTTELNNNRYQVVNRGGVGYIPAVAASITANIANANFRNGHEFVITDESDANTPVTIVLDDDAFVKSTNFGSSSGDYDHESRIFFNEFSVLLTTTATVTGTTDFAYDSVDDKEFAINGVVVDFSSATTLAGVISVINTKMDLEGIAVVATDELGGNGTGAGTKLKLTATNVDLTIAESDSSDSSGTLADLGLTAGTILATLDATSVITDINEQTSDSLVQATEVSGEIKISLGGELPVTITYAAESSVDLEAYIGIPSGTVIASASSVVVAINDHADLDGLIASLDSAGRLVIDGQDTADFTIEVGSGSEVYTVDLSGASRTMPVRITSINHGLNDGEMVTIDGVDGMTELNGGVYAVNVYDAHSFDLYEIIDGKTFDKTEDNIITQVEELQPLNGIDFTAYTQPDSITVTGTVVNALVDATEMTLLINGITVDFDLSPYNLQSVVTSINNAQIPGVSPSLVNSQLVLTGNGTDITIAEDIASNGGSRTVGILDISNTVGIDELGFTDGQSDTYTAAFVQYTGTATNPVVNNNDTLDITANGVNHVVTFTTSTGLTLDDVVAEITAVFGSDSELQASVHTAGDTFLRLTMTEGNTLDINAGTANAQLGLTEGTYNVGDVVANLVTSEEVFATVTSDLSTGTTAGQQIVINNTIVEFDANDVLSGETIAQAITDAVPGVTAETLLDDSTSATSTDDFKITLTGAADIDITVEASTQVTVTTDVDHEFTSGLTIRITDVEGLTAINDANYSISHAAGNRFVLNDFVIDSAASDFDSTYEGYVADSGVIKSSPVISLGLTEGTTEFTPNGTAQVDAVTSLGLVSGTVEHTVDSDPMYIGLRAEPEVLTGSDIYINGEQIIFADTNSSGVVEIDEIIAQIDSITSGDEIDAIGYESYDQSTAINLEGFEIPTSGDVSIEIADHGFTTGDTVTVGHILVDGLPTHALNDEEFTITVVDTNTFTLDGSDNSLNTEAETFAVEIVRHDFGSSIVIRTQDEHNIITGNRVRLDGFVLQSDLNYATAGVFTAIRIDDYEFALANTDALRVDLREHNKADSDAFVISRPSSVGASGRLRVELAGHNIDSGNRIKFTGLDISTELNYDSVVDNLYQVIRINDDEFELLGTEYLDVTLDSNPDSTDSTDGIMDDNSVGKLTVIFGGVAQEDSTGLAEATMVTGTITKKLTHVKITSNNESLIVKVGDNDLSIDIAGIDNYNTEGLVEIYTQEIHNLKTGDTVSFGDISTLGGLDNTGPWEITVTGDKKFTVGTLDQGVLYPEYGNPTFESADIVSNIGTRLVDDIIINGTTVNISSMGIDEVVDAINTSAIDNVEAKLVDRIVFTNINGDITLENYVADINNVTIVNNVVTIETVEAHGLQAGDAITIAGVVQPTNLNASHTVLTVVNERSIVLDDITDKSSWLDYTSGGTVQTDNTLIKLGFATGYQTATADVLRKNVSTLTSSRLIQHAEITNGTKFAINGLTVTVVGNGITGLQSGVDNATRNSLEVITVANGTHLQIVSYGKDLTVDTTNDSAADDISIDGIYTHVTPVLVRATGHGLASGSTVEFSNVVGTTELNNERFEVSVIDSDWFTLPNVDVSQLSAYTGNSVVTGTSVQPNLTPGDDITLNGETIAFTSNTINGIVNDINNANITGVYARNNSGALEITSVGEDLVIGRGEVSRTTKIQDISKSNPCVVTAPGHALQNGSTVIFTDIVGMTQLNYATNGNTEYTIQNVTANTFELAGVNSIAFFDYVQGENATVTSANTNPTVFEGHGMTINGVDVVFLGTNGPSVVNAINDAEIPGVFAQFISGQVRLTGEDVDIEIDDNENANVVKTITGASNTSPMILTVPSHGLESGETIDVGPIAGMTGFGTGADYEITKLTDNTFSIVFDASNPASVGAFQAEQDPQASGSIVDPRIAADGHTLFINGSKVEFNAGNLQSIVRTINEAGIPGISAESDLDRVTITSDDADLVISDNDGTVIPESIVSDTVNIAGVELGANTLVSTVDDHNLAFGVLVKLENMLGTDELNNTVYRVRNVIDARTFEIGNVDGTALDTSDSSYDAYVNSVNAEVTGTETTPTVRFGSSLTLNGVNVNFNNGTLYEDEVISAINTQLANGGVDYITASYNGSKQLVLTSDTSAEQENIVIRDFNTPNAFGVAESVVTVVGSVNVATPDGSAIVSDGETFAINGTQITVVGTTLEQVENAINDANIPGIEASVDLNDSNQVDIVTVDLTDDQDVTVTTATAHGFVINDIVIFVEADSTLDYATSLRTFRVDTTPTTTSFTLRSTDGGDYNWDSSASDRVQKPVYDLTITSTGYNMTIVAGTMDLADIGLVADTYYTEDALLTGTVDLSAGIATGATVSINGVGIVLTDSIESTLDDIVDSINTSMETLDIDITASNAGGQLHLLGGASTDITIGGGSTSANSIIEDITIDTANEIYVEVTNNDFVDGDRITINGVAGMEGINGETFYVEVFTSDNTIRLYEDKALTTPASEASTEYEDFAKIVITSDDNFVGTDTADATMSFTINGSTIAVVPADTIDDVVATINTAAIVGVRARKYTVDGAERLQILGNVDSIVIADATDDSSTQSGNVMSNIGLAEGTSTPILTGFARRTVLDDLGLEVGTTEHTPSGNTVTNALIGLGFTGNENVEYFPPSEITIGSIISLNRLGFTEATTAHTSGGYVVHDTLYELGLSEITVPHLSSGSIDTDGLMTLHLTAGTESWVGSEHNDIAVIEPITTLKRLGLETLYDTFELVDVDGTGFGTYTTGGRVVKDALTDLGILPGTYLFQAAAEAEVVGDVFGDNDSVTVVAGDSIYVGTHIEGEIAEVEIFFSGSTLADVIRNINDTMEARNWNITASDQNGQLQLVGDNMDITLRNGLGKGLTDIGFRVPADAPIYGDGEKRAVYSYIPPSFVTKSVLQELGLASGTYEYTPYGKATVNSTVMSDLGLLDGTSDNYTRTSVFVTGSVSDPIVPTENFFINGVQVPLTGKTIAEVAADITNAGIPGVVGDDQGDAVAIKGTNVNLLLQEGTSGLANPINAEVIGTISNPVVVGGLDLEINGVSVTLSGGDAVTGLTNTVNDINFANIPGIVATTIVDALRIVGTGVDITIGTGSQPMLLSQLGLTVGTTKHVPARPGTLEVLGFDIIDEIIPMSASATGSEYNPLVISPDNIVINNVKFPFSSPTLDSLVEEINLSNANGFLPGVTAETNQYLGIRSTATMSINNHVTGIENIVVDQDEGVLELGLTAGTTTSNVGIVNGTEFRPNVYGNFYVNGVEINFPETTPWDSVVNTINSKLISVGSNVVAYDNVGYIRFVGGNGTGTTGNTVTIGSGTYGTATTNLGITRHNVIVTGSVSNPSLKVGDTVIINGTEVVFTGEDEFTSVSQVAVDITNAVPNVDAYITGSSQIQIVGRGFPVTISEGTRNTVEVTTTADHYLLVGQNADFQGIIGKINVSSTNATPTLGASHTFTVNGVLIDECDNVDSIVANIEAKVTAGDLVGIEASNNSGILTITSLVGNVQLADGTSTPLAELGIAPGIYTPAADGVVVLNNNIYEVTKVVNPRKFVVDNVAFSTYNDYGSGGEVYTSDVLALLGLGSQTIPVNSVTGFAEAISTIELPQVPQGSAIAVNGQSVVFKTVQPGTNVVGLTEIIKDINNVLVDAEAFRAENLVLEGIGVNIELSGSHERIETDLGIQFGTYNRVAQVTGIVANPTATIPPSIFIDGEEVFFTLGQGGIATAQNIADSINNAVALAIANTGGSSNPSPLTYITAGVDAEGRLQIRKTGGSGATSLTLAAGQNITADILNIFGMQLTAVSAGGMRVGQLRFMIEPGADSFSMDDQYNLTTSDVDVTFSGKFENGLFVLTYENAEATDVTFNYTFDLWKI